MEFYVEQSLENDNKRIVKVWNMSILAQEMSTNLVLMREN